MFDFRRITLFCLEKRLSKHKMAIFSKYFGGHGPFGPPPGYVYARVPVLALLLYFVRKGTEHKCNCNIYAVTREQHILRRKVLYYFACRSQLNSVNQVK